MNQQDNSEESQPMNPIALTLAVWLGLIVGVTGLARMSEQAAARAALAQANGPVAEDSLAFNPRIIAFGG